MHAYTGAISKPLPHPLGAYLLLRINSSDCVPLCRWPEYVFCADLIHDPGMHVSLLSTLAVSRAPLLHTAMRACACQYISSRQRMTREWPQAMFRGGSICSVMTCGRRDPQKEVDFRRCAGAEPFKFRIEERTREALLDEESVSLLIIHPPSWT